MKVLARYYPNYVSPESSQQPAAADEDGRYYYAEQGQDKHLRDYWNILAQAHAAIWLRSSAAPSRWGLFSIFSLPTLYTGKVNLENRAAKPERQRRRRRGGRAQREGGGPYDYYQTQFVLLKSGPLVARVIKNLGLASNPAFKDNTNIFKWTYNWIVGSIVGAYRFH